MSKFKVNVIGLGYIGLPTASLIADSGMSVVGIDINKEVVDTINKGRIHIVEPKLAILVEDVVNKGLLKAQTHISPADIFIIAVPTPFNDKYKPDLSYLDKSIEMIIPHLNVNNLIIIESTCPIGTTEVITDRIFNNRKELLNNIFISYCPERVLPGNIIFELVHNDRIIGGVNAQSSEKAEKFYQKFTKGKTLKTDSKTAEMCKIVENASRDVNIAFANELSIIADKAEIDVWELISLANRHPRVNILSPGPGVGGHCIAVDPWFIVSEYPEDSNIMHQARKTNLMKVEWVISKITSVINNFKNTNKNDFPTVACLGLTYKPDIDDIRESPSLYIINELISLNICNVLAVDPNVDKINNVKLIDYKYAIDNSDIIIYLVNHKEFKQRPINKIILDFCGDT